MTRIKFDNKAPQKSTCFYLLVSAYKLCLGLYANPILYKTYFIRKHLGTNHLSYIHLRKFDTKEHLPVCAFSFL